MKASKYFAKTRLTAAAMLLLLCGACNGLKESSEMNHHEARSDEQVDVDSMPLSIIYDNDMNFRKEIENHISRAKAPDKSIRPPYNN